MNIDDKLAGDLGVALNEASLAGLEYSAKGNVAAATFVCLTPSEDGTEPNDSRRQFVFHRVGRIAASLRLGRWDDADAFVERFEVSDLLSVVHSFGCQPVYGWEFFNVHKKELSRWGKRLSLDLRRDKGSMKNSVSLFQEAAKSDKHLDLCLWFESFVIRDAKGNEIVLDDFIAGGVRWWEAMHAGDERTQGHGIVSAREWRPTTTCHIFAISRAFSKMLRRSVGGTREKGERHVETHRETTEGEPCIAEPWADPSTCGPVLHCLRT